LRIFTERNLLSMKKKNTIAIILVSLIGAGALTWYLSNRQKTGNEFTKEMALARQADEFYENALYDSAAVYYNKAGVVANERYHYDTALFFINRALEIVQSIIDTNGVEGIEMLSETYLNKGKIFYEKSMYLDAYNIAYQGFINYKRIQELDSSRFDKIKVAEFYYRLGLMSSFSGKYEQGRNYCDLALVAIENHSNISAHRIRGLVNSEIGRLYFIFGDFDKGLEYFLLSNQIFNTYFKLDTTLLAKGLSTLAISYAEKEMYDKAFDIYNKALQLVEGSENKYMFRKYMLYHNMGDTYNNLGNHEKALFYWDKALYTVIKFRGKLHRDVAFLYNNMSRLYFAIEDYNNSLYYNEKALTIQVELLGKKHIETAFSYGNRGKIFLERRDYSNALICFQNALISIAHDFNSTNFSSNPQLKNLPSKYYLFKLLNSKAEAFYSRYINEGNTPENLDIAIKTSTLAIQLLDSIRTDFKPKGSRLILSKQSKLAFTSAIRFAFTKKEIDPNYSMEDIFGLSEKCKSNVFITSLFDTKAKQNALIPDSLLHKETFLREELTNKQISLQNELEKSGGYDTAKIEKYEEEFLQLLQEKNVLTKHIETNHPEYINLRSKFQVTSVKDIQSLLTKEEALISYFVGDTTLTTFVITKERYIAQEVICHDTLEKKINQYLGSIRLSRNDQFAELSYWFYEFLIKPIAPALKNIKSLILIPDESLYYIPFETLISEKWQDHGNIDMTQLQYLIKDYNISYNYSATLWQEKRKAKIEKKLSADNKIEKSFIGFAPVFEDHNKIHADNLGLSDSTVDTDVLRSLSYDGKTFNDLPHSRKEVNTITRLFKQHGKQATAKISGEATEDSFKANVNEYEIVHLATHGYANNEFPDFAWLAFSPKVDLTNVKNSITRNNSIAEDGILYSGEMHTLDLNADLVVLSACETGVGKLVKGEGLMAMTRGFLYSGTSNIIFSLWKVSDKHTAELMIDFYKETLNGNTYSESLRNAKLRMIENRTSALPVLWSSFLLIAN